jgi:hypothetical protein
MANLFFRNTRTGKRYKVLRWDQDTQEMDLVGEEPPAARFTIRFNKEAFKQMGYRPEQED